MEKYKSEIDRKFRLLKEQREYVEADHLMKALLEQLR